MASNLYCDLMNRRITKSQWNNIRKEPRYGLFAEYTDVNFKVTVEFHGVTDDKAPPEYWSRYKVKFSNKASGGWVDDPANTELFYDLKEAIGYWRVALLGRTEMKLDNIVLHEYKSVKGHEFGELPVTTYFKEKEEKEEAIRKVEINTPKASIYGDAW